MGACAGKPSKPKDNKRQAEKYEEKKPDEEKDKSDKKMKSGQQIEDTKADDQPATTNQVSAEKKSSVGEQQQQPPEVENNSQKQQIEQQRGSLEIPAQYSTNEITINKKWDYLVNDQTHNHIIHIHGQVLNKTYKKDESIAKEGEPWLFTEVRKIIKKMNFSSNENRFFVIRRAAESVKMYAEAYENNKFKDVQKITQNYNQRFGEWMTLLYFESDDDYKTSIPALLEVSMVAFYYIYNLYNFQKQQILHKNSQTFGKQGTITQEQQLIQSQEICEAINSAIRKTKDVIQTDFPYIADYKFRQTRAKINTNIYLNELFSGVQKKFRKNKSPLEIGNEYLDVLYEDVLDIMQDQVPQDDYVHLCHMNKNYCAPQVRMHELLEKR